MERYAIALQGGYAVESRRGLRLNLTVNFAAHPLRSYSPKWVFRVCLEYHNL
jgi:hypothetical protein